MHHARPNTVCILFLIGCCAAGTRAAAADYEETVSAKLAESEAADLIRLRAGAQEFVALFMPATTVDSDRAALILHGMGGHADWPDVVAPLRHGLPAQGWATLSIQLPVMTPGAPWADYGITMRRVPARIDSAVACLSRLGYHELAVIGYGFGATAAAQYLAASGKGFSAFVGVSMQAPSFLMPRPDLLENLRRIGVPILDIFGSRDHADILRETDDRRLAGTLDRARHYEQSVVDGADHDYAGFEPVLIDRIAAWLDRIARTGEPRVSPAGTGTLSVDVCRTVTN